MKILGLSNLYPPDFLGGYEIGCSQLVDALRERGHELLVATAVPRYPVTGDPPHVRRIFELVDEWNPNQMGTHPFIQRVHESGSRLVNAHNARMLINLLDGFSPDVVFISNIVGLGGLGLLGCLQFLKVPWVWHLGDCVPRVLCSRYMVFDRVVPALAREFSRQMAGRYIVVSQQLRDEIETSGIELGGIVEIIPYWINGERPESRPRHARSEGGPLRIMSAGQVSREKGVDLLIEAAAIVCDSGRADFLLDIYGQVEGPAFEALIREHRLHDRVRLMGVRPHAQLLELYGRYDVFAFPSRNREPFGLVPLEAAARGCVPLITQRTGVAEWLVHGVHCLKVERTARAFAAAFSSILDGTTDLGPIGRRAEVTTWRDFHIDAIIPRIENALIEAARQSRDGAGSADEAYRLARLAEQLSQSLIQEAACASV